MVPWAVLPTAGRGTRLLPATAVVPKVLLPVGTVPMLHWAVAEAIQAGVEGLVLVVSPGGGLVRDYLDVVRRAGSTSGNSEMESLGRSLSRCELVWIEQPSALGVGDALIRCRAVTGADSFAVLMPDNWFDAGRPAIAQVHASFAEWGLDAIGLTRVAHRDASRYGNVGGVELLRLGGDCHRVLALQDKGTGSFPIRGRRAVLRGCARYVLRASFYEALSSTGPPERGEWDDVPAFQELIRREGLIGHQIEGCHFDLGLPAGLRAATTHLAAADCDSVAGD